MKQQTKQSKMKYFYFITRVRKISDHVYNTVTDLFYITTIIKTLTTIKIFTN